MAGKVEGLRIAGHTFSGEEIERIEIAHTRPSPPISLAAESDLEPDTMEAHHLVGLVAGATAIAFLYTSVGHAGATGYIAMMSLFGLPPELIKPTALALNIIAATIATWQFRRAGHFSWSLFWPFALLAPPLAFAGGYLQLPPRTFQALVGSVLLFSAYRFLVRPGPDVAGRPPAVPIALATGSGLGLIAGLTGTGGGVLLTPLVLFLRWARVKAAAAIAAPFILLNSVAGLAGHATRTGEIPIVALVLCGAVAGAALSGSYMGSSRFDPIFVKRLLSGVLAIAGVKMLGGF